MAQAFVTTYKNFFRWPEIDRRKPILPIDKFSSQLPEGDIWVVPKKIGEDEGEEGTSLAAAEAAVRRMYRTRLWTIYQMDYCSDIIPEKARKDSESSENALLAYGDALYDSSKGKIPPPLPTSRRLCGYMRPSRMYTPLSTYQKKHGEPAYRILKKENLKSVSAPANEESTKVKEENTNENANKAGLKVHKKKRKDLEHLKESSTVDYSGCDCVCLSKCRQ